MVKAEHADTKDKFLRLWCHEESRVFRDRLISAEDRTWFNDALQVPTLFIALIAPENVPCSRRTPSTRTHEQAPLLSENMHHSSGGIPSQSVLLEFLDVDWRTDQFADLLFGDYLNRDDKVCFFMVPDGHFVHSVCGTEVEAPPVGRFARVECLPYPFS